MSSELVLLAASIVHYKTSLNPGYRDCTNKNPGAERPGSSSCFVCVEA